MQCTAPWAKSKPDQGAAREIGHVLARGAKVSAPSTFRIPLTLSAPHAYYAQDGDKFWKISEVYIRGNTIKYLRIPDEVGLCASD